MRFLPFPQTTLDFLSRCYSGATPFDLLTPALECGAPRRGCASRTNFVAPRFLLLPKIRLFSPPRCNVWAASFLIPSLAWNFVEAAL